MMNILRTIIIDDEELGCVALKTLINRHFPDLIVLETATDPDDGIKLIEKYRPEVVFLDISMPKMNGFKLLEKLNYKDFKVVFTTAHREYAIEAIKFRAFDYLLKPIDLDELRICIEHLVAPNHEQNADIENIIELNVKDGIIFIKPKDIIRLEASGSYSVFYLENGVRHMASKNLKEVGKLLKQSYFYRCHPSHIINLQKVSKLVSSDGLFVLMTDGSRPEILRRNKTEFLERLKAV